MASQEGLEPPTPNLEGSCSIRMSYWLWWEEILPGRVDADAEYRRRINDWPLNGRGERIRTFDPLVPNQMRYQTALRSDKPVILPRSGSEVRVSLPVVSGDATGSCSLAVGYM